MTQLEFQKIKDVNKDEILLIYQFGHFNTPVCILDRFDMNRMKVELEKKL